MLPLPLFFLLLASPNSEASNPQQQRQRCLLDRRLSSLRCRDADLSEIKASLAAVDDESITSLDVNACNVRFVAAPIAGEGENGHERNATFCDVSLHDEQGKLVGKVELNSTFYLKTKKGIKMCYPTIQG